MNDIALLDPWRDAAEIARRLAGEDARLLVVLGAESWCEKCRAARPALEAQLRTMQAADAASVFLWLDIEEHAEFLGSYLPEDLPWLVAVGRVDPAWWAAKAAGQGDGGCAGCDDDGLRAEELRT